jgi:hypothetical protein
MKIIWTLAIFYPKGPMSSWTFDTKPVISHQVDGSYSFLYPDEKGVMRGITCNFPFIMTELAIDEGADKNG